MKRWIPWLVLWMAAALSGAPAGACVGKTLVVGAVQSPEGQVVAQVIAILINERTGTTVKIEDFADADTLHEGLTSGRVDIGVEHVGRALGRLQLPVPGDDEEAYRRVKSAYLESLNLVWLPPLGFHRVGAGLAAPVARKDTLKKFPALPRLIAKTRGLLPDEVLAGLLREEEASRAARQLLRDKKLI
ncbi:MAG: lipoprotein [Deferrisomatales bacterium]